MGAKFPAKPAPHLLALTDNFFWQQWCVLPGLGPVRIGERGKYMSKKFLFSALCIAAFANMFAQACQIYVDTNGSDTKGDGSKAAPFASLKKAVEKFSELKNGGVKAGKILFSPGFYFFEDSVNFDCDISPEDGAELLITSAAPGSVRFTGAKRISADKLVEVSDKAVLGKLPKERTAKVFCLNLKEFGIHDYGTLKRVGFTHKIEPVQMEVFLDDAPLELAGYPNKGILKIGDVLDPGWIAAVASGGNPDAKKLKPDNNIRGATFKYDFDRPDRWANVKNAWLDGIFSVGWADDRSKIKSIDTKNKTITLQSPHVYGVRTCNFIEGKSDWSVKQDLNVRGYRAINLLEELDNPGEYYIDTETGMFYVALDKKPKGGFFDFSVNEKPFVVLRSASNIKFLNIDFAASRGPGLVALNSRRISLTSCRFFNLGNYGAAFGNIGTNHILYDSGNIGNSSAAFYPSTKQIKDWKIRNKFNNYTSQIKVQNCKFFNLGMGGLFIGGGDRVTLESSQNLVTNCEFYNNARIRKLFSPSLRLAGVGTVASHNYVHDHQHMTVALDGNDIVVEKNVFERCCLNSSDMGVIYTNRDKSMQGNIVRYNLFLDNPPAHPENHVCGVYIDWGTGGGYIERNIFCNTGDSFFGAVYFHGGHDSIVKENVFIDCLRVALHLHWDERRYRYNVNEELNVFKLYTGSAECPVNINSPIYKKKYPNLGNIFIENYPRKNTFVSNYAYNSGWIMHGEWSARGNAEMNPSAEVPRPIKWDAATLKKYFGNNWIVNVVLSQKPGLTN